jgi:hypothetical protein
MFSKLEISIWRAFFWPVANLLYWGLIFLSWWDTRFKVFLGAEMLDGFARLRSMPAVMANIDALRDRAAVAVAENGAMQGDFMIIPLVMAVVMFIVPFVVRRDFKGPVSGAVVLPAMTMLCYFFASFLNLVIVAAMSAGIHYLLFRVPGPDIFMFMVHPLYLIYPVFQSETGLLSQCLYLVYAATVLCTESAPEYEEYDDEDLAGGVGDDDWDKSACLMEMDRLTRILNAKFDTPSFIERLRGDISSYVNRPSLVKNEVRLGLPHYKIVLTATKNSLRAMLDEDPKTPKASDAFTFIVDEMLRMDYISADDARAMKPASDAKPVDPASLLKELERLAEKQKTNGEAGERPAQTPTDEQNNGGAAR